METLANHRLTLDSVGSYFNNNVDVSGLTSLGSVMRHLNGKLGRLKMLLKKEYELDIQLVWCDVSDNIMTSNYSFGVVGIQFNMEGISHHLDELVYDVLSDNLIELIEDCKLDVVDK